MAIMTETCDVEIQAGGSVTIPEGNWKITGASGWLTGAAGVGAASKVRRTRGGSTVDCCGGFAKGDGSAVANLDGAKTANTWESIEFDNLDIEAGDVIEVTSTAVSSEVHVTLKRT